MKVRIRIFSEKIKQVQQAIHFYETKNVYEFIGEYQYQNVLFQTPIISQPKNIPSINLSADVDSFSESDLDELTRKLSDDTKGFVIGEILLAQPIFSHYDNGKKTNAFGFQSSKKTLYAKMNEILVNDLHVACEFSHPNCP